MVELSKYMISDCRLTLAFTNFFFSIKFSFKILLELVLIGYK
jgi:hypothetical protein